MEYTADYMDMKARRVAERKKTLTILAILLVAFLAPFSIWLLHHDKGWDKFDRKQWDVGGSALAETESGCRKRMVDDLLKNYLRPGTTRRQVRELLGPPEFVESNPMYEYQVARSTGFRLAFDRQGYFTTAAVVHY